MVEHPDNDASPLRRTRKSAAGAQSGASSPASTASVARPRRPEPAAVVTPVEEVPPVPESTGSGRTRSRPTPRFWLVLVSAAIVVGFVVAAVAAYAVSKSSPTFQSQALLEIDQAHALAASPDDGVVAKLSRLRFKYAGLVRTQVFAAPVATNTKLPLGAIGGALYAGVDPNSLLLAVGARSGDRTRAQTIAAAGAQELIDYAHTEQTANQIPSAEQVTFSIVTPAGPGAKVSPTHRRIYLVGLGAFLFVAAGTVGFGYLWRRDS